MAHSRSIFVFLTHQSFWFYSKKIVTEQDKQGQTLLHAAASYINNVFRNQVEQDATEVEVIAMLLKHGADVTAKDKMGRTPFLCAAAYGHHSLFEELAPKGYLSFPFLAVSLSLFSLLAVSLSLFSLLAVSLSLFPFRSLSLFYLPMHALLRELRNWGSKLFIFDLLQ